MVLHIHENLKYNDNNAAGTCLCSFRYGYDTIRIFEVPDSNVGYMEGWIFLFNTTPYYCSVAGGSDRLAQNLADFYALYLSEHGTESDKSSLEKDDAAAEWKLHWEAAFDFHSDFEEAMTDAGLVMDDESGVWERKAQDCYA